jgi:hypothetical protein
MNLEFNYTNVKQTDLDMTIFKLKIKLIDLNDNKPTFDVSMKDLYYLNENCDLNTTVTYISAFDLDKTDKFIYKIVNNSDSFAIDEHTGRLYTIGMIDYEVTSLYKLKILIENPGDLKSDLKSLI